jgi:hypothetical protein
MTPATPLLPVTTEERLVGDFGGIGLTMEPHLMAYYPTEINRASVVLLPTCERCRTALTEASLESRLKIWQKWTFLRLRL